MSCGPIIHVWQYPAKKGDHCLCGTKVRAEPDVQVPGHHTCRFCGGSGPDPWLGTHDCPNAQAVGVNPENDEIYRYRCIASLRRKVTAAPRRGGILLGRDVAIAILRHIDHLEITLSDRGAPSVSASGDSK